MEVACGQCLGCRLDRSRMWAMRIVHESTLYETGNGNCFITLTYRDPEICSTQELLDGKHIPADWSLRKTDFQKFMKRLRKARPGAKLKYFHCGEYSNTCRHGLDLETVKCPLCNVGRPHYHAILFNCSFVDLEPYGQTPDGRTLYMSPELEKIWGFGIVDVSEVNWQSAAYVSRYCLKKVNGLNQQDHYSTVEHDGTITFLDPEYATMSNGIGSEWYEKYAEDLWPSDEVPVPGHGVVKKVPRYYEEKLKAIDADLHEYIKEKRIKFRTENAHEYTAERLHSKYRVKQAQTKNLKRD